MPVKAILAFDLGLSQIDTSRCSARVQTGRVEKWQLSSEDHARILRLLSETLDDCVAAALPLEKFEREVIIMPSCIMNILAFT